MANRTESAKGIVERLEEIAGRKDKVCVGDLLDAYGSQSFGPLLIVFALIEISPFGAIPGVPTILAAIIALIAVQMVVGRDHVWLPGFVEKRAIASERIEKGENKLLKVAGFIDRFSSTRLEWAAREPFIQLAGATVIALCATVPPLEVVPFASAAPMLAIAAIGLALTMRDGLLMLLAFAATFATVYFAGSALAGGGG